MANDLERVMEFAIAGEEESARFYRDLAQRTKHRAMGEVLEGFAREEERHRDQLVALKEKGIAPAASPGGSVPSLDVASYVVELEITDAMTFDDALVLAMQREKAAYRLYTDLAAWARDASVRELLLGLAAQEAHHKLRFEIAYDESLAEN